jgi:hypothetical protein
MPTPMEMPVNTPMKEVPPETQLLWMVVDADKHRKTVEFNKHYDYVTIKL